MKKEGLQRTAEKSLYTLDQLVKVALGFIPGGHVIDSFIHYSSGLKQERLLGFAEDLKKLFAKELGKELEDYNFETEDFVDVFDSVMKRVISTNSSYKLDRFKAILLNTVKGESDLAQVYVNLTVTLTETQIRILDYFETSLVDRQELVTVIERTHFDCESAKSRLDLLRQKANDGPIRPDESLSGQEREIASMELKFIRGKEEYLRFTRDLPRRFGVTESEFSFYRQDLLSKALLEEHTSSLLSDGTTITFVKTTEFAGDYLNYVKL